MTSKSLGQYLPASLPSLKKRAKRVHAVLDVPLMKVQNSLASLYGFSSFDEASRRANAGAAPPADVFRFHASNETHRVLTAARDEAAIAMACRLTGVDSAGARERAVASLGLFDSDEEHGEAYHGVQRALDAVRALHASVELPTSARLEQMVDQRREFVVESSTLMLAIQTAMSIEDDIGYHRLHGLALDSPDLPWAAAGALVKAMRDGALAWVPEMGLKPAATRAWGLRHLASWALEGYSKLQPTELSDPDETDAYSYLRGESMLAAGQVFALIGRHREAARAYQLAMTSPGSLQSPVPLETLLAISHLHLRLPALTNGRDRWTRRGSPRSFEIAFVRALGHYQSAMQADPVRSRIQRGRGDHYLARALASTPHLLEVMADSKPPADGRGDASLDYVQQIIDRLHWVLPTTDGNLSGMELARHLDLVFNSQEVLHATDLLHTGSDDAYASNIRVIERAIAMAAHRWIQEAPHTPRAKTSTEELDMRIAKGRQMRREGVAPFFNIVHNDAYEMEATGWLLEHLGHPGRPLSVPDVDASLGREQFEMFYGVLWHEGVTDFMRARFALHATRHYLHGDAEYMRTAREAWDAMEFDEETFAEIPRPIG